MQVDKTHLIGVTVKCPKTGEHFNLEHNDILIHASGDEGDEFSLGYATATLSFTCQQCDKYHEIVLFDDYA